MSSYLCPSCNGIGEVPYSTVDPLAQVTRCLTCAGTGSIGAPERMPIGFRCPFCSTAHAPQNDCHAGADLACCGEVGHCEPIYREENDEDIF